ncbi:TolC family protein [Luteibacter anthropi]|uniref:efflux transporter outer membrane subunit n=1 Tax=Luteibacter anthropi TaxID=564369 RepID=UPI0020330B4F|nr:TolC family protein [Luteibacter anthropi]URX61166.1 TolC family protein [Luteibacter anthropi]
MLPRTWPAAMLCVALAGCASQPPLPPHTTVALPVSTSPAADTTPDRWWTLYRLPALDAAVAEALANNRDLRVAEANLREARAALGEARRERLPTTTLTAGAGYGSALEDQIEAALKNQQAIRTGTRYTAGLDVEWEVDLFGRLRHAIGAAQAQSGAMAAAEDGMRIAVAAETTRAWLGACTYGHRLEIARHSLALVEHGRDVARSRRDAGDGVLLDVVRAEALVERTRASLAPLDAARQRSLAELATLMGRTPDRVPGEASACTALPSTTLPPPDGDATAMLRRRPDVREAEYQLATSSARLGEIRAELWPKVSFGASIAGSAHHPDGLDDHAARIWNIGPLLSWQFPNIAVVRARITQAGERENAALARFDASILDALKDTRQALLSYEAALHEREALANAAERSATGLHLAEASRAAGAIGALEHLDAQRDDVSAQAALAESDGRVIDTQIALFKALGGGWRDAPPVALPHPERATAYLSSGTTP